MRTNCTADYWTCPWGGCKNCKPEDLDHAAMRLLSEAAAKEGMGFSEYLRAAGILTPWQVKEIKRRERSLK